MGRKQSGLFEDLFEVAFKLPWWIGVTAAALAFVLFHSIASMDLPKAAGLQNMGEVVGKQLWRTISSFLQWIVPLVLLAGAGASAIKQRKRRALYENVATSSNAKAIFNLSWSDFERFVGEAFRLKGFQVEETGRAGPDGGVDLVLQRHNETHLVQCKQWRASKVSVSTVRELYGVMAATGAAAGYVVTSGAFTADALAFAKGRNIQLIDGGKLAAMISNGRASLASEQAAPKVETVRHVVCPQCNEPMIKRVAKRGSNAGEKFWGCSAFPKCRGTRPLNG